MVCSFIPVFSGSSIAKSVENTSGYSKYLVGISVKALFYYKVAIWAIWKIWIIVTFRIDIYIIKVSEFLSSTAFMNTFLSINSILLVVDKAFAIV